VREPEFHESSFDVDCVQLASDLLSKNFPLRGCPVNPNEAEIFFC